MLKKLIYLSLLIFIIASCRNNDSEGAYRFFVAGHTYGKPGGDNPGLHPPFIQAFGWLNGQQDIEFGVLTGDIVRRSDTLSWDSVDAQLSELYMKVWFCPGNHDTYNRPLYESRYGKTYYSFQRGSDLFIVLDGNLDRWNISGKQLDFLLSTLENIDSGIRQVFIFVHQLIWWDSQNIFSRVNLNWPPYTPEKTNYWSEIEPVLQDLSVPVVFFAGDLGANRQATAVMFHQEGNISYIASGMGNGENDNFIIVSVNENKSPEYELISLTGERNSMGALRDYELEKPD